MLSESTLYQLVAYSRNFLRNGTHIIINGQSVSMSRYRAHSGTCDQILLSVWRSSSESCCLVFVGRPLRREVGSVICLSQPVVIYQYLHQAFTLPRSRTHIKTDGLSVIMSRYRAHSGTCDQILLSVRRLFSEIHYTLTDLRTFSISTKSLFFSYVQYFQNFETFFSEILKMFKDGILDYISNQFNIFLLY
jgi:hypothetical protein